MNSLLAFKNKLHIDFIKSIALGPELEQNWAEIRRKKTAGVKIIYVKNWWRNTTAQKLYNL